MIKMSFLVDDSKSCLEQAGPDLGNMNCRIYYKKVQDVFTVSETIQSGTPMAMNEEKVEKIMNNELKRIEKGEGMVHVWVDQKPLICHIS